MRCGAVGINLTSASHVFLLEPALNPALEEQAIGRAWRMGQQRPVVVKRLYAKGTVEENIRALAESRQPGSLLVADQHVARSWPRSSPGSFVQDLNEHAGVAGIASARWGRRSIPNTVIRCLQVDRQNRKLAELELLFSEMKDRDSLAEEPQAVAGTA